VTQIQRDTSPSAHVLQCVAECCSALQCVAVRCSVLQCVAVCCSVLLLSICTRQGYLKRIGFGEIETLPHACVAVCCSAVQCVAVRCSMLHLKICQNVEGTWRGSDSARQKSFSLLLSLVLCFSLALSLPRAGLPGIPPPPLCCLGDIYRRAHAYTTHTCAHACMHARTQPRTQTDTHVHTHTRMHARTHTRMHARTHTHEHTRTHTNARTCP